MPKIRGVDVDWLSSLPTVPDCPDYCYDPKTWKVYRFTPAKGTWPGKEIAGYFDKEGRKAWQIKRQDRTVCTMMRSVIVCSHYHGPRPDGLLALHDNGNPGEDTKGNLYWGTMAQNMADMVRHGRAGRASGARHGSVTKPQSLRRGSNHPKAILDEDAVLKIRREEGRHIDIALKYSVSRSIVGMIKRREVWKHLEEEA